MKMNRRDSLVAELQTLENRIRVQVVTAVLLIALVLVLVAVAISDIQRISGGGDPGSYVYFSCLFGAVVATFWGISRASSANRSAESAAKIRVDLRTLDAAERKEARDEKERLEWQRERAELEAQRDVDQLEQQIRETPDEVARLYRLSVEKLEAASATMDRATRLFAARSFSPFWKSVERALGSLAAHRAHVEILEQRIRGYSELVTRGEAVGLDSAPTLPQSLGEVAKSTSAARIAEKIDRLVAAAFSDYEFASIYEQRRTTAAVIEGFSSLSDAVDRIGDLLVTAYRDLLETVEAGSTDVVAAVEAGAKANDLTAGLGTFTNPHSVAGQIMQANRSLAGINANLG